MLKEGQHSTWHKKKDNCGCYQEETGYDTSQVVYSKQPKLGLTQEFVVDCAHALWVVHSIKTSIINVAEMVFI